MLILLALLGAAMGAIWAFTTPTVEVTVTPDGGVLAAPAELANFFSGAAYFTLLAFLLGIVCAVVVWFVHSQVRGMVGLVASVGISFIAGAIGLQVGMGIAESRYSSLDAAAPGTQHLVQNLWLADAALGTFAVPWLLLICAPGMAALTYLICAIVGGDESFVTDAERQAAADRLAAAAQVAQEYEYHPEYQQPEYPGAQNQQPVDQQPRS